MCGIAGLISPRPPTAAQLRAMTDAIAARGPDDAGIWLDEAAGVGLGLRRLAVVDLSAQGHQPMLSHDGRYVLVYNGEIYNHAALRRELDAATARTWRGHSDTETLLEAIAAWGLKGALQRCVGMFALALWDRRERILQLARDRFGEKPLYYGWTGGDFGFASDLKAMPESMRGNGVSRRALGLLASQAYIPAPLSIFAHAYKLEPGCLLTAAADVYRHRPEGPPREGESRGGLLLERYWSYKEVVAAGLADPITDENEAVERLEGALSAAIDGQTRADVPLGALLSGGVDSSTVVALGQRLRAAPLRTFTLGFDDPRYDEAGHARQVAAHFGTEHHECVVTVAAARDVIPLLPAMFSEPFADPSQIPTFLLSRFARGAVKVALSGDGGDELFGGYERYSTATRLWAGMQAIPGPLRRPLGRGLSAVSPVTWGRLGRVVPRGLRPEHAGWKAHRYFDLLRSAASAGDVFRALIRNPDGTASVIGAAPFEPGPGFDLPPDAGAPDQVRMMYADAISYLPDDILCKVDRAAMAVSLETRAPFLDHRVAALAARIPLGMKIGGRRGKLILRKLLDRHAPGALVDRPKKGFGIPLDDWLRGPLRDWAEALLDERRLGSEGFLDPVLVRRQWDWHVRGVRDGAFALWPILMFQAWLAASKEVFPRHPG